MRKYELTEETCKLNSATLYRIRALVTIPGVVEAGELGGWIKNEENLSHDGECWVGDDAKVSGNAKVRDNALVFGSARVYGNARIYGSATVYGNAEVYGDAKVYGSATVYDNAEVCHQANVFGNAEVYGSATVYDNAKVYGNSEVYGNAGVSGDTEVCQHAGVYGYTRVFDGNIVDRYDCVTVGPVGSMGNFTTLNLSTGTVCTGCFKGTMDEFEKAVEKTHGDNEHGVAYKTLIEYFKMLIKNKVNEYGKRRVF